MMTGSLWRHTDFMKLWLGQTVSELGSVVTRTAVPLVALLVLGAGPLEMALLIVSASGLIGVRGGIAVGWAGMALSILLLVLSPLPRVRQPSDVPAVEA